MAYHCFVINMVVHNYGHIGIANKIPPPLLLTPLPFPAEVHGKFCTFWGAVCTQLSDCHHSVALAKAWSQKASLATEALARQQGARSKKGASSVRLGAPGC